MLALQLFKQTKQDAFRETGGALKDLLGFTGINQDWFTTLARILQMEKRMKQEIWVLGTQDLGVGVGMSLRSGGHAEGILEVRWKTPLSALLHA